MKKYFALIFGSFLVLSGLAKPAAAQAGRNDRVCVYRDNNFNGREQCYYPGDEVSDLKDAEVSSIRVYGRAAAIIFEDRKFRGNTMEIASNAADLARLSMSGSKAWNDRVGSMQIISDSRGYARGRNRDSRYDPYESYPSTTPDSQNSVCVYENTNFQGRSQCWAAGSEMPDLAGLSDKISSIRVNGSRVVIYRDIDFRGERQVIDRDISNLSQLQMPGYGSWNDQISSLETQNERGSGRNNRRRRF